MVAEFAHPSLDAGDISGFSENEMHRALAIVQTLLSDSSLVDEDGGEDRRHLMEWLMEHEFHSREEAEWFYVFNIVGTLSMIFCVAVISALFLGMMTLDAMDLKIIERSSLDEDERKYAAALHPIVKLRHRLLVSLLILNALAYEALPLFLDKLVPTWLAISLSTTLVLVFGEIIPTAIFIGPNQLLLGYHMVPLVQVLLIVVYPLAKPLSLLLDWIVHGPDGPDLMAEEYNRGELMALVNIQYEQQQIRTKADARKILKAGGKKQQVTPTNEPYSSWPAFQSNVTETDTWSAMKQELLQAAHERQKEYNDDLTELDLAMVPPMDKQEVDVVVGALKLKTRVATDVYTPTRHVYAIPDDLKLDKRCMTAIYAQGYSRVPVYRRQSDEPGDISCVIGFLMTRRLMLIDWDHEREINTLPLQKPRAVSPRLNLVQLLKLLRTGGSLMALVCARPDLANRALQADKPIPVEAGFMGIVTLEDVLESILQTRIYDEEDIRDRDRAVGTLKRWAALKLQQFARKKVKQRRSLTNGSSFNSTSNGTGIQPSESTEQTPLLGSDTCV